MNESNFICIGKVILYERERPCGVSFFLFSFVVLFRSSPWKKMEIIVYRDYH